MSRQTNVAIAVLAIAAILQGCDYTAKPPLGTPSPAASLDPQTKAAIEFRLRYGLRHDETWVRFVGADPASAAGLDAYGVPLTPSELTLLNERLRTTAELRELVDAYGRRYPASWGGVWVDPAEGLVIAQFTGALAIHQAALFSQVSPKAPLEIRQVTWSLADLEQFRSQVTANSAWLGTIEAELIDANVDTSANVVRVLISSSNPDASAALRTHFGSPTWLTVESDEIGRWTGPIGTLRIVAQDPAGTPVGGLDCDIQPDVPAAFRDGVGYETDEDGACEIKGVGATHYDVYLRQIVNGNDEIVGTGAVDVVPNVTTVLIIVVE